MRRLGIAGAGFCALLFSSWTASAFQVLRPSGAAAPAQQVEFSVFLPLQNQAGLDQLLLNLHTPGSPQYHKWLTPAQFRAQFGAKKADVDTVTNTLTPYGLQVTQVYSQSVQFKGSVQAVQNALGVQLSNGVSQSGKKAIITNGHIVLPAALTAVGAKVVHFSPFIRNRVHSINAGPVPANRRALNGPYWFDDLKQAYDFPSVQQLDGTGSTIAIVIGSDVNPSDISAYFAHEGITGPTVTTRMVDGGAPFSLFNDNSVEAELDVQQAGGMAPGSHIIVYDIPDLSDSHILDGYVAVIEDNNADIVNSSFGGPEGVYLPSYNNGEDFTFILDIYDSIFRQGNAQGITFVCSSGDNGALDLPPVSYFYAEPTGAIIGEFVPGVEHPASDPNVTAVGGTNLRTSYIPGSLQSTYLEENALGDRLIPIDPYGTGNLLVGGFWGSGGGISQHFPLPAYQQPSELPTFGTMRNVPDVSLHMGGCPSGESHLPCGPGLRSADYSIFNGNLIGLIGTSASSPDFAGLLALQDEYYQSRFGNENYYIYYLAHSQFAGTLRREVFRDRFPGDNGFYRTGLFYDHVLGVGTVNGRAFIEGGFFPQVPLLPAGNPQTPSNP